ncbi:TerD family protein, partial [Streptomyces sp. NPDC059152]|uniref:TerD family protein n=1 Tax=Streptomyces sp. NPDC059152 TaxID=3346742 RepID=UPI0036CA3822
MSVLLALPGGPGAPRSFGAAAAPSIAVTRVDGTPLVAYPVTGLGAESALVAVELYRRRGAWRIRAVGQGYAGGLAELLHDLGLRRAAELAAEIEEAAGHHRAPTAAAPGGGAPSPPQSPAPRDPQGTPRTPAAGPPPPAPRGPGASRPP